MALRAAGRRTWRARRTAGLLAVLVLGSTVLSACSDGSDPSYVPVESGRLTAVRPVAWQTPMTVDAPWTMGFQPAPSSVEQIQVSGDFGSYVTAAEAGGSLVGIGQVGLDGFKVVQTRDLTIANATSAQAVRYTITDNEGSQVAGEWIVAVRWPERQSVAVSILTPAFDPELERKVIDSIRFTPTG